MECLNNISVKQFTFSRLHLHIINSCLVFKIELAVTSSSQNISFTSKDSKTTSSLTPETYMTSYFVCVYIFFQYIIYIMVIFSSSIFHTSIKNRCAICRLSSVKLKSPKGRDWLWSNLPIAGSKQTPPHRRWNTSVHFICSISRARTVFDRQCFLCL